jgi:DNA-binding transcriptional ArsR family regulator
MARPSQLPPLWSQAEPLLFNGPVSARQLASSLRVSQPTVSRLISLHRDQVLVVGQARSTKYIARRPIVDVGTTTPVYEVDEAGRTRRLAVVHGTGTRGFYVEPCCDVVGQPVDPISADGRSRSARCHALLEE